MAFRRMSRRGGHNNAHVHVWNTEVGEEQRALITRIVRMKHMFFYPPLGVACKWRHQSITAWIDSAVGQIQFHCLCTGYAMTSSVKSTHGIWQLMVTTSLIVLMFSMATVAWIPTNDEESMSCLEGRRRCEADVTCRVLTDTISKVCDKSGRRAFRSHIYRS